ncbi:MAG: tetraacyldisaccharide 4'-kinase [Bryobacteraceae bacterium]
MPLVLLYWVWRGLRNRAYWASLPERFGFLPSSFTQTGQGAIWLHAVSVGEVLGAMELMRGLRAAFPRTAIFVSSGTLAGHATSRAKLDGLADGVFFAPMDYVFAVRRVLRTLRPAVVLVVETEIWPNLFRECQRTGAGLAIVNGRISDRAFPPYRRWAWWFGAVWSADRIQVQSAEMRERYLALGAPPERVEVAGNFKYDFAARAAPADSPVRRWLAARQPAAVWIAASTMPGAEAGDVDEDQCVVESWLRLALRHPGLVLIWAPRKPERFDLAADKLAAAGVAYDRRSQLGGADPLVRARPPGRALPPRVLLLDTIGELSGLFDTADVVFMGGTLARRGGHNILEPALFAKPVIVGPHMENFTAIADQFRRTGAVAEIAGPDELAETVSALLDDPERRRQLGRRALSAAEARRGATARALAAVRELYATRIPVYRPAWPWYPLARVLAGAWTVASGLRQKWQRLTARNLPVPVISVGNLTMGGTGKTPCVLSLAAGLIERGHAPGILTRGYGRISPEPISVMEPGAQVSSAETGDEPQIFLRSGLAPVGIGADRFRAGQLLLARFPLVDTILLDDGLQHRRLERAVNLVLVDALDPFGGGAVFPLGRLREPLDALARADIFLITRADLSAGVPALERALGARNSRAPVFHAVTRPHAWVEAANGREYDPAATPFDRPAGFCGLGNPQSFRQTLKTLGIRLVDWVQFPDHHRYRPAELKRMGRWLRDEGARALVTTEKDAVNLCEGFEDLLAPLPLFYLKIALEIARRDELLDAIEQRTTRAGDT